MLLNTSSTWWKWVEVFAMTSLFLYLQRLLITCVVYNRIFYEKMKLKLIFSLTLYMTCHKCSCCKASQNQNEDIFFESLTAIHILKELDFWKQTRGIGLPADIRVTPSQLEYVDKHFSDAGLTYTIKHHDIQRWAQHLHTNIVQPSASL